MSDAKPSGNDGEIFGVSNPPLSFCSFKRPFRPFSPPGVVRGKNGKHRTEVPSLSVSDEHLFHIPRTNWPRATQPAAVSKPQLRVVGNSSPAD